MIPPRAAVIFVIGAACPLKCDFCCHDRETIGAKRMSVRFMTDTMIGFAGHPDVARFTFTGGDPFLYYDDIVAVVRKARAAGVVQPFTVITSGYWAMQGKTRERLALLQEIGLERLSLSYDTQHARWVTPEQIMEICRTCRDLGIDVELFATFWDEAEDIRDLLPEIHQYAVEVHSDLVVPSGRAGRSGRRARHNMPEHLKYGCGKPNDYLIAIYADGEAFPCCGADFNRQAGLSAGNVRTDSAAEILERAYGNFHVRMAKEFGWGVLYDIVRRDFPELAAELPRFEDADGPCEICRDLNVRLKDRLAPVYDRIEAEYARTMAEFEWDRKGGDCASRRLGCRTLTKDELGASLAEDPALRRQYIAGRVSLERA